MRKMFVPVAVLAVALAAMLTAMLVTLVAPATPAYSQTVSEDLAADEDGNLVGPRPPAYEVDENGFLIIGGDVLIPCGDIGVSQDPESREAGPIPEAEAKKIERAMGAEIRTCQAAGFDTAGDLPAGNSPSPSAPAAGGDSTLPETGGVMLQALLLLAAGVSLTAVAPLALKRARR